MHPVPGRDSTAIGAELGPTFMVAPSLFYRPIETML